MKQEKENWETVETDDEPDRLYLPPFNAKARRGDREYMAVGTYMDVLGMRNVPYIGMVVIQDEKVVAKFIEMDEAAHEFLVKEGLTGAAARALVALAAALRP